MICNKLCPTPMIFEVPCQFHHFSLVIAWHIPFLSQSCRSLLIFALEPCCQYNHLHWLNSRVRNGTRPLPWCDKREVSIFCGFKFSYFFKYQEVDKAVGIISLCHHHWHFKGRFGSNCYWRCHYNWWYWCCHDSLCFVVTLKPTILLYMEHCCIIFSCATNSVISHVRHVILC